MKIYHSIRQSIHKRRERRRIIEQTVRELFIAVFDWIIPCSFMHFCRMAKGRCEDQGLQVSYEEIERYVERYWNKQAKNIGRP